MSDVPFDRVIWDAAQCAAYLGEKYSTFIKRTQYVDGFPARCPKPGQPRWPAYAVTEWALRGPNSAQITNEADSPSTV